MENNSTLLHKWFNDLKRHTFDFDKNEICQNGLYVLFESGEKFEGMDRIVRIGTHTGQNNLVKRLTEHFLTPNKDRSVFRKHIGRSILVRDNKLDLLAQWNIDLTTKKSREKWAEKIDKAALQVVENEVSDYMQNHFTFAVIPIESKVNRLFFEAGLVATVLQSPNFYPSQNWLGKFATHLKIRESGLWQVQGLNGKPLDFDSIENLRALSLAE